MYKRKKIPEMYTSKYLDLKMFLYKAKKKQSKKDTIDLFVQYKCSI